MQRGRVRGFALLIVLWAVAPLSLLLTLLATSGRTDAQLASNLRSAAAAEAAADGAVFETLFHLLAPREERWTAPGSYRLSAPRATVQVSIENLAGRVNPNTVTPELMRELLVALGMDLPRAATLGAAIVEWRTPRRLPGGRILPPPGNGAPGKPFEDLRDLGDVPGLTPGLLALLRPHLTLWWENDPDPSAADPVVMTAMRAIGDTRRSGPAESPLLVVSIVATATGADGGRFIRHVDALVRPAAAGAPWRILAWERRDA